MRPGAEPLGYMVCGSFGSEAHSDCVVDVVELSVMVVSDDGDGDSDSRSSLVCSVVDTGRGVNAGSFTDVELLPPQEVSTSASGTAPAMSILRVWVT